MSKNALKTVMESGKNVVESGASTLSDLVDEARSRIEDLPQIAHHRRKRSRKNWSSLLALGLLVLFATLAAKQLRQHPTAADQTAERSTATR
jgi:hypothetical protein